MSPLRLGVIGFSGRQGQRYLDEQNWPPGIDCFPVGHADNLACDGVIIAAPPAAHLVCIQRAAGIPVLCEKPMAIDHLEARVIARHDAPLLIAHTHLWHRDFLRLEPSPAATVRWCGPEREDGSCPANLDWGAHAWSMALALQTTRVTTGAGDRQENEVRSRGERYASIPTGPIRPMRDMLASFATLIRGGEDWRASTEFALDVHRRSLGPRQVSAR